MQLLICTFFLFALFENEELNDVFSVYQFSFLPLRNLVNYWNNTRMLCSILNNFSNHHPTKQQLYGHFPPISQTIQAKRVRHTKHWWRSKDKLIRNVLLWILTHDTSVGWPIKTYTHQLHADTGCWLEDLPRALTSKDGWQESQGNLYCWHALMMIMKYMSILIISEFSILHLKTVLFF